MQSKYSIEALRLMAKTNYLPHYSHCFLIQCQLALYYLTRLA